MVNKGEPPVVFFTERQFGHHNVNDYPETQEPTEMEIITQNYAKITKS
jgi:hypothetical protein